MRFKTSLIFLLTCLITLTMGSDVRQCKGSKTRKLEPTEVSETNCEKGTCKLKRKSTVDITLKFSPEVDIKKQTTTVYANVVNTPLPFIGVNGTSACDNVFLEDGETKTSCPLKAGEKYVYKNSFPVVQIYPKLNLVVHWALTSKDQDVVCFELPAKIL